MATNIILIRHAEKPSDNPLVAGVTESGRRDPEELTVRGWQRAGALVTLFAPRSGHFADARLAAPDVIFASGIAPHSKSLRSQHTVLPLSKMLVKAIDLSHPKGDEEGLVNDVLGANGVVLVAWEHEAIPRIANQILGNDPPSPRPTVIGS